MVDATQFLLVFVIVVITVMLSVISVQVFFILREFRNTLTKVNKVLGDAGVVSESVSRPVSLLSSMLMGIKGGSSLMQALTNKKKGVKENVREE